MAQAMMIRVFAVIALFVNVQPVPKQLVQLAHLRIQ